VSATRPARPTVVAPIEQQSVPDALGAFGRARYTGHARHIDHERRCLNHTPRAQRPMSPIRCPRCTFTLAPARSCDADVDVCPRCRGAFVHPAAGDVVWGTRQDLEAWASRGLARSRGLGRLSCPARDAAAPHGPMSVWTVDVAGGVSVDVDVCDRCLGLWLDAGESRRLLRMRHAVQRAPASSSTPPMNEPPPGEEKTGLLWYLLQAFSALPVEVYNPRRRVPVACFVLMAACVATFALEFGALAASDGGFVARFGVVPVELLRGMNVTGVFTYMFLHAGVAHLVGNLWFLWTFGDNVEDRVGHFRFLALYVVFGVIAAGAHAVANPDATMPLVGASGAVSGVLGVYVALFPRAQLWQVLFFFRFRVPVWVYAGGWAFLNIASAWAAQEGMVHSAVAWWAHVGGFVAGVAWGALRGRPWRDGAEARPGPDAAPS
jgi:membrane associated rhomboid family serine protease/Zn-finger nucleic acid-binding protein